MKAFAFVLVATTSQTQKYVQSVPATDVTKVFLCVVEDANDVMAIENTAQFNGLYHVLGGVISPINGVGPAELKIESLVNRLNHGQSEIKELILALSPTHGR